MRKSIIAVVLVVSMLLSSCLLSGIVTAKANDMTEEDYIASLQEKKVTIDFTVAVNTDEWGLYDGNDDTVLSSLHFGVFTAENKTSTDSYGKEHVTEADTLIKTGRVYNENATGNVKALHFDDGVVTTNELVLPNCLVK